MGQLAIGAVSIGDTEALHSVLQTLCSKHGAPRMSRLSLRGLLLTYTYDKTAFQPLYFSMLHCKVKDVSTIGGDLRALSWERFAILAALQRI